MAKKTARTRSTAQRNKPRAQKSFELVRQTATETEAEVASSPEPTNSEVVTTTTPVSDKESKKAAPAPVPMGEKESTKAIATHNASASERLAARRQAAQKAQQRSSAPLITADHYSYVRKDLIYIAILALIMFSIIIGLHFVPALGG